jgi:hypothetical protein
MTQLARFNPEHRLGRLAVSRVRVRAPARDSLAAPAPAVGRPAKKEGAMGFVRSKRYLVSTVAVAVGVGVFLVVLLGQRAGAAAHPRRDCDARSVEGSYGYTVSGTNLAAGLVAAVGVVTSDGRGTLAGSDTLSANGTVLRRIITGTYTITAACTGTVTFADNFGQTVNLDFVLVDDRNELRFIQTDAGTIITGNARRL